MWFMSSASAEAVTQAAAPAVKGEMLSVGTSFLDSLLGYLVVFIGLTLLMIVIMLVGKIMVASAKKSKAAVPAPAAPAQPAAEKAPVQKKLAPGSAGEVKLYDTDPRDAAMIMAIVANKLQKPLNELRFISIREVK